MTWTAQDLDFKNLSNEDKIRMLPKHLQDIITLSIKLQLDLKKIWIYGSRARGDARANSDFDLAFDVGNPKLWSLFVTEIEDDPPSLYHYDLVDIKRADESLKKSIDREGVLIYERE
jgi:predicted nucleotidyltransferase